MRLLIFLFPLIAVVLGLATPCGWATTRRRPRAYRASVRPAQPDADEWEVLRFVNTSLVRRLRDRRHTQGGRIGPTDRRADIPDCWKVPLIGSSPTGGNPQENHVIFLFDSLSFSAPLQVTLCGTFGPDGWQDHIPLRPLLYQGQTTGILWTTLDLPKSRLYHYGFTVNDQFIADPINPQRDTRDSGLACSRFFTEGYRAPLVLNAVERRLLDRLSRYLLPFRTATDAEVSVGTVQFIDHWLAREEWYYLPDYQTGLAAIDHFLARSDSGIPSWQATSAVFRTLFQQMAEDTVTDWRAPFQASAFLRLLKRHVWCGAFATAAVGGCPDQPGQLYILERYGIDLRSPTGGGER